MKELVGKILTGIDIDASNQEYLTVHTTEGDFNYAAEGDCCSHSYFSEIMGVSFLDGEHKVKAVESIDLGAGVRKKDSDEEVRVYGIRLLFNDDGWSTESMIIVFRNSSNGYYGGSCELIASIPATKEKYEGSEIPIKMVKVESDFSL